jgi:multiple sugar transport system substrate-binding protein
MQLKTGRALFLFAGGPLSALAALLLSWAAGCGPSASTQPVPASARFEGATVRVACPAGPAATVVERYARPWASQKGARLEVIRSDPLSGPPQGNADAWVIAPAELARWANDGRLLPVPANLAKADDPFAWGDLLLVYRSKLLKWGRDNYALPLLGDALLCFYRADRFQEKQHQEAFQKKHGRPLAAPATWDEFADVAEYFRDAGGMGPSLPPLAADADGLDREFYSVAASFVRSAHAGEASRKASSAERFSFHFDSETGEPRIGTPGFVHALRLLQRLQKCRPPDPAREPAEAFRDGRAALCLAAPSWIARFNSDAKLRGKFGVCRVPGGSEVFDYHSGQPREVPGGNYVPYLGAGGGLMVVPRDSAQPEAAWDLLADLSGPKTSREIVIEPAWGGGPFRRSHLDSREGWYAFELGRTQTSALVDGLRQSVEASNPVLRLRVPGERVYLEALVEEIRPALAKGGDPQKALATVAERWQKFHADQDPKAWRSEYRRSLGLDP